MYSDYDLVIVGAGPAGLALAHYCSKIRHMRVLIIEKENTIGGCHAVHRVQNNLFSEHAPRVYVSTYVNFSDILSDIDLPFEKLFKPMKFQSLDITRSSIMKYFTIRELYSLVYELVMYIFDESRGKQITVSEFMKQSNYSKESYRTIDILCRMSDGATSEMFSMNSFLEYLNQNLLHKFYQSSEPNDVLLFHRWQRYLEHRGVTIMTSSRVERFHYNDNNHIKSCDIIHENGQRKTIYAKKFVLAIPPANIVSLIKQTGVINAFGDINVLQKWAYDTKYIEYISITFHWNKKIRMPDNYVFPSTEWCIFHVELNDTMDLKDDRSKTVLSVAATKLNTKSNTIGKTANECRDRDELIKEIYRQLKITIPSLTDDYIALLEPNTYYDEDKMSWCLRGTAYVSTIFSKPIPSNSRLYTNLYNLGTHNGRSIYKPTTFESAVSNSMALACEMYPELKQTLKMKKAIALKELLTWLVIMIPIFALIYYVVKRVHCYNKMKK